MKMNPERKAGLIIIALTAGAIIIITVVGGIATAINERTC